MHANAAVIARFYRSFGARDAAGMAACYAPDVKFWDPVFLDLEGERAAAMWSMLCERATDLAIEVSGIEADAACGKAHWDARYTFTGTGRPVVNRIDAAFEFRDGMIARHRDSFDLWKWSAMALGMKGRLLGWLPPVQNAIRAQARKGLDAYLARPR